MNNSFSRRTFVVLACGLALAPSVASAGSLGTDAEPVTIIGGDPSLSCAWPSTVFLENCTGTLIHPEIVVYAAHCDAERERVWFGEDVSSGAVPPGEGFFVETEYCMVNPEYATATQIGPSRAADYAFCKLAEPVLDVPIVPPLMGCETTALLPGTPVKLVGFGGTDQSTFAVKFQVDTVLHYIDDWGAAVIGGGGQSPCAGDSGGPAFMQLPDGSWRSFGIVSGPNFGNCGDAMWFATIYDAIPFIEANSGIDVSACHHTHGEWNPSPSCEGFPLDPGDGDGKSWADGCAGGPTTGPVTTCGDAFDGADDLAAPSATITAPEDRARFDTGAGDATYPVEVTAEIADPGSGVARVELEINGAPVDKSLLLGPPWAWPLNIPPGVWEIEAVATDWAGNEARSEVVVIGIDTDPPPAPEPEPSDDTGPASDSSDSGEPPMPATTTGVGDGSSGDASEDVTGTEGTPQVGDGGCGCRQGSPGGGWALFALALGLRWRRRSRGAAAIAAAITIGGCTDDPATSADTTGTQGTTDAPPSTSGLGTTSTADDDTGFPHDGSESSSTGSATSESSSEGGGCELGTLDCACTSDFSCGAGLSCYVNTCIACEAGTFACPCVYEKGGDEGTCARGLYCFGGLCVAPQPCPFLEDGQCDEPQGTGLCLVGTDASDCCPTMPGVCEERSEGGACPDGSDPVDCGAGSSSDSGSSDSGSSSESSDSGSSDSGSSDSGSSDSGSSSDGA
jgi:MYXO-CTERM domain-containing protein